MTTRTLISIFTGCALAVTGCLDSGLTIKTDDDVGRAQDVAQTDTAGTIDALLADSSGETVEEIVPEVVPEEATAEVDAPDGPTCAEGLQCLVDLKNWEPGQPLDQGACLEGISDGEMEQVDGLLTCVDDNCIAEFEAFEDGGDTELAALYLCMIDKCATDISVCIGGQGEENCADAIFCLSACNPLDMICTIPCLENTTEEQSEKAGKFLQCALDDCGGMEQLPACDISMACGLKCPELAGG
jgi:hypothetical protein